MPLVLDQRDAKGRILPGSTLTGHGRNRSLERRVRELVDFDKIIAHLQQIALGQMPKDGTYGEITVKVRDSIEASKLLFDRGHGKAKITIDLAGDITAKGIGGVDTESLDDQALAILRDAIAGQLEPRRRVIDARVVERAEGVPDSGTGVLVSGTAHELVQASSPPGAITNEPAVSSEIVERQAAPVAAPSEPEPAREIVRHVFKGSANVTSATLDVASGVVEVVFTSGARFRYANFSRDLLTQWGLAVSAGKWFNVSVRGKADKHPPVRW